MKKKDVGYCGQIFEVGGSVLLAEREGENKKGSVLENAVNTQAILTNKMPRILVNFQTGYKMTSQPSALAWIMDEKNPYLHY